MLRGFGKKLSPQRLFSAAARSSDLHQLKAAGIRRMLEKYPHLKLQGFSGKIAYVLRDETPKEMVKTGGFLAHEKSFWLSNTGSGDNSGSVCFSLLPEITSLFVREGKPAYIYAFPLHGDFLLPGGPWRQIISPGAFPLTSAWRAREVLGFVSERRLHPVAKVKLGPVEGEGIWPESSDDSRLADYLNEKEHRLIKPTALLTSDDHPQEYEIVDTVESENFQREVTEHYEQQSFRRASLKPRG